MPSPLPSGASRAHIFSTDKVNITFSSLIPNYNSSLHALFWFQFVVDQRDRESEVYHEPLISELPHVSFITDINKRTRTTLNLLSNLTWTKGKEYLKQDNRIILPLGATEEHGSHLGTDLIEVEINNQIPFSKFHLTPDGY